MRIQLIDAVSEPGNSDKANEDLAVASENLCVVLDGATGLGDQAITSYQSDAVWFVRAISNRLLKCWEQERDFIAALSRAVDESAAEYAELTGGVQRPVYEQPSAGMVAIAVEYGTVSAYRLGDCMGYVCNDEFAKRVFGPSPLEALDSRVISAMIPKIKQGKTLQEVRREVLPMLRSHRELMNRPDGYGALSLSRDCLQYVEIETLSPASEGSVLLATDGFDAIEKYAHYDLETLFKRCEADGLASIVDEIRTTERGDSEQTKFPRLKRHDDATAVLLRLERSYKQTSICYGYGLID